jgi:hypothetical protein
MNAQELALNIAVNLGRIGRWAYEGRRDRLDQFLDQTEEYIRQLEQAPKSARFQKTFDIFKEAFYLRKNEMRLDSEWAEAMFTWANILTHRAKLA